MAARWARENQVPYLGLCLGMQVMCIEFSRVISCKVTSQTVPSLMLIPSILVISLMPDQHHLTDKGGTMCPSIYPCTSGNKSGNRYDAESVTERHQAIVGSSIMRIGKFGGAGNGV
ncbi:MAG: hypothetical protein R3E31_04330 [Chloroflexota bacterium]